VPTPRRLPDGRDGARFLAMSGTIIQVLDSMAEEASGPSQSVPRLCAALGERGANVELLTIGDSAVAAKGWRHRAFAPGFASVPLLRRLRFSHRLAAALNEAARTADVIHAHGLWLMANIYPAAAARRAGKPFILSPRGMLAKDALAISARKKTMLWALAQGRAARAAACLHATSEQEYRDIRAFGLSAPVAIIRNGIDVPPVSPEPAVDGESRTLLYLGRLHPHKGIDQLLEAFLRIGPRHLDWRLDIAGPLDSDYARSLETRVGKSAASRIRFLGALYGAEKMKAYGRAQLFVLPSRSENFAMTVAEALSAGTPVICSKGAPWAGLETHGCGWWIEPRADQLVAALERAMCLDRRSLAAMGQAGRAWMAADFGWDAVAADMQSVYAWLGGRGARPSCVVEA
jgi:glycosyltransferase involved in cell wall biosynthesis